MKRLSGMATWWWGANQESNEDCKRHVTEDSLVRIFGARDSGKTTLLYRLYFKQRANEESQFEVHPTENHNVEVVSYGDYRLQMWDFAEIGFSLEHKQQIDVLIYVVDGVKWTQSPAEKDKAQEDVRWLLQHCSSQLQDALIVTVINKSDDKDAATAQMITEAWQQDETLIKLLRGHDWKVFECSALAGQGLDTMLAYIAHKLDTRGMTASRRYNLQQRRSISSSSSCRLPHTHTYSSTITARSPRVESRRWSSMSALNCRKDFQPAVKVKLPATPWEDIPNPHHLEDHEFIIRFRSARTFLFFDHCALLRAVFLTLKREKSDLHAGTRKNSLSTRRFLHNLCAVLRDVELHQQHEGSIGESIPYSETQALFWIHMVSFALLRHPILEDDNKGFVAFLARCPELQNTTAWREYYSSRIFNSELAKREFIPPDRKPFPNAFKPSALALKGSGLSIDYQIL